MVIEQFHITAQHIANDMHIIIVHLIHIMEIIFHNTINNKTVLHISRLLLNVRLFYIGYMVSDNINGILILWFFLREYRKSCVKNPSVIK